MQKIIVIEGTDGSSKQTQTSRLFERLKDRQLNVKRLAFPNYDSLSSGPLKMYLGGELGDSPNSLNAYQASTLFAVDRLITMKQFENSNNQDAILLLDRYVQSNIIHQACKIPDEKSRNEFVEWLYDFEFNVLNLPKPDLVYFLNMPPKYSLKLANNRQALKFGTKKDIHEKDSDYQTKAYETGLDMASKFGWQIINCVNDKGEIKSIDEINEEIINIFDQIILNEVN